MCTTKNRSVSKVNADGLCLLNAFKSCLLHDFGEIISIRTVKEKITGFYVRMQNNMLDCMQKVQVLYWKMFKCSLKQLPPDVDGMKWYKIKSTSENYAQKTGDRRWFLNRTSSRVNFSQIRKVGKCLGSFVCHNPSCSYPSTEGKKNEYKFEYMFKRVMFIAHVEYLLNK